MTARGYEQDTALRNLTKRVLRLELKEARNRPVSGIVASDPGGFTPPLTGPDLNTIIQELLDLIAAGSGVTDHGALTGLADDDHPQYSTDADLAAHTGDTTDAHDASAISIADAGGWLAAAEVEASLQELAAKTIGYQAHGSMGATETFDAAIGWHSGTFTANCVFTLTGAPSGTVSSLFLELAAGAGGFTLDLPASVVNAAALEAAYDSTAGTTSFLILLSRDNGTTWYGGWWGGSAALDYAESGDIAAVGSSASAGVSTEVPRADHVHPLNGAALGLVGPLLISSTPSTPLIFDDILQNTDQDDFVYGSI
jgi:hypothetical protein